MSLLLLVVKASLVLLAALAAAAMLGRSPAVARHRLWSFAFALLLAVPALTLVMPSLKLPIPSLAKRASALEALPRLGGPWSSPAVKSSVIPEKPIETYQSHISQSVELPQGAAGVSRVDAFDLGVVFLAVWASGAAVALVMLALSLFRISRLSNASAELDDAGWQKASQEISARLGLASAPRLIVSGDVSSPMAGGVAQPTVFLPMSAREWDAERRDVVLTHEIAHLASRDPLRHLVARAAVACYWFHPLAWLAAHRATVSREQACDEAVLAAGTRPSAYARVLLELAESLGPGSAPLTALPMAQRSNLESRLMTILKNGARPTASSTRPWPIAAVSLALITFSVAAAQPSAAVTEIVNKNNVSTFSGPAGSGLEPVVTTAAEKPAEKSAERVSEKDAAEPQTASTTSACRWNNDGGSFSGSTWSTNSGVTMRVGRSDSQTVVQRSFDGLRVCMVADGVWERVERPAQIMDSAPRVSMSSERDGQTQQMDIVRQGGSAQTTWRVNGRERQLDASAEEWRRSMLAVLATVWEVSSLRGQESSMHGQISSIHGRESSLRGRISSIGGRVSSLQGQISSVRGHESSLRGQISSIEGQLSSMRGQISSEQGAISSLSSRRYDASTSERQRIDARVEEHRRRIREIEKEIAAFDAAAKVREVEKEIAIYDADKREREIRREIDEYNAAQKIREVEKEIAGLKVGDEVREIEKQIQSLNAGPRVKALEAQQDDQLRRLRAAIAAIR